MDDEAGLAARRLLRAARAGTLATAVDGQPFASLITPAVAADGSILLLLSDLSEHTRHLRADRRCAVIVTGTADGANAQTAPRVTVTGLAELSDDPELKARWIALHPYAAFYAGFDDFHLWRLPPLAGLFVGGFARAHRLRQAELVPGAAAAAEVAQSEKDILAHCNADHPDALGAIAADCGFTGDGWLMAACDVDGCDLVLGDIVRRVDWPAPVVDAGGVRTALVHLAGAARKRAKSDAGLA